MKTYLRLFRDSQYFTDSEGRQYMETTSPDPEDYKRWAAEALRRKELALATLFGMALGIVLTIVSLLIFTNAFHNHA